MDVEHGKATDGFTSPTTTGNMREDTMILSGNEPEKLTLFEKKALLVNDELDAHGMGKYQWVSNVDAQI